tara:strand:- start:33 stop:857 length:825 start_codon:yes stop_codon:yes gene_type:complete
MKGKNFNEIVYITLKDSERSLNYYNYLNSINLIAKPFFGFDFRKLSDLNQFNNFSKKKFYKRYGRNPTSSEIGCTLSHLKAIQLSDSPEPLIILEDDALFKVKLKVFLRIVEFIKNVNKYEIVIFGFSKCDEISDYELNIVNPFLPIFNLKNLKYSIGERLIHSTSGALGYYLSPSAKRKISSLENIFHVADDWNFYSNLGLKIGYVYPSILIEDLDQKSTLNHNEQYFRPSNSNNKLLNNLYVCRRYLIGFFRKLFLIFKVNIVDKISTFIEY